MGFSGFEYKIGGRTVSQEEWVRHLGQEAVERAKPDLLANIKADISELRCSVHGQSPKIVKTEWRGNSLHTSISACCDAMLKRAQQAAARQSAQ